MDRLGLYWKNATADVLGEGHGVSEMDLRQLAPRLKSLIKQAADDRKAGKSPYRELPYDEEMVDAINSEVEHFRDRCESLIVLGIGGSAQGSIALQDALNPRTYNVMSERVRTGPQLFVIDSADPDQVKAVADLVAPRLKKTILNVISRSGETVETAAQFFYFRDLLQGKLGKKYGDNILAITGAAGPLRQIATAEGYRTLALREGVSGRLSILSAAGLFSAAICGTDIDAILEGARDMDKRCKDPDPLANPAALLAALHYLFLAKGKTLNVMMPFATALQSLADWFCQLWPAGGQSAATGLGGPTAIAAAGVSDFHAQAKLHLEGPADKLITFLEVERFGQKLTIPPPPKEAAALQYVSGSNFQALTLAGKMAAEHLLREGGRPTITVVFPTISPQTVGQFVCLYEVAAGYLAALLETGTDDGPPAAHVRDATAALMGRAEMADLAKKIQASAKRDSKFLL
jgi:glucose-6-phosphate isomerase